MPGHKRITFLPALLSRIAPTLGADVFIEPEWGSAGMIAFPNGTRAYFRDSALDINPLAAAKIAKDKHYAKLFMKRLGYPVIEGDVFCSEAWARAIGSGKTAGKAAAYAESIGYPVIAKPNSGSQGENVMIAASSGELLESLSLIHRKDPLALVERYASGREYRIVVLDGEILLVYERTPLAVTGDGSSAISVLIEEKERDLTAHRRTIRIDANDPRILRTLAHQGFSPESVPSEGAAVALLSNANLSAGGDMTQVPTASIDPDLARKIAGLGRDMNLRFSGVDIMVERGSIESAEAWSVIEINHSPGFEHFASAGPDELAVVEAIYRSVLEAIEQS